jgi:hypothetical protein
MTSIEWLIEEMLSKGFFKESVTLTNIDHLQYKAEEMHKQEIINTWSEATSPDHEIGLSDTNYIIAQIQKAEEYYQETFKK